jgi:hypothetical protein
MATSSWDKLPSDCVGVLDVCNRGQKRCFYQSRAVRPHGFPTNDRVRNGERRRVVHTSPGSTMKHGHKLEELRGDCSTHYLCNLSFIFVGAGYQNHHSPAILKMIIQVFIAGDRSCRGVVLTANSEEKLDQVLWDAELTRVHANDNSPPCETNRLIRGCGEHDGTQRGSRACTLRRQGQSRLVASA